eukprot:3562876-Alexandrium_andersonii.AAC.1
MPINGKAMAGHRGPPQATASGPSGANRTRAGSTLRHAWRPQLRADQSPQSKGSDPELRQATSARDAARRRHRLSSKSA